MSEQEPQVQPPRPEEVNYHDFFDSLKQFDKSCASRHRPLSTYDYVYDSPKTPIRINFSKERGLYLLKITGNHGKIPMNLVGLEDNKMNIHQMVFWMGPHEMFIAGRFMNSVQAEGRGDPEISLLKPDTRVLLHLLPLTTPKIKPN